MVIGIVIITAIVSFASNMNSYFTESVAQHVAYDFRPTGGRKSTKASLIPQFYDPAGGRVLIDGTDIVDFDLDGLRVQIGFELQGTVLFYGSLRENIAYGKPNAT